MSVRRESWTKVDENGRKRTIKSYRVDIKFVHPDGRVERVRKASENWSKRDAERWERETRYALANPKPAKREDIPTVAVFFTEWMKSDCIARGNRASTLAEKQGDYRRYIGPLLGKLRLDEVTFRELTKFVAKLIEDHKLTPKTARNIAGTAGRMLRYASKLGIISGVPEMPDLKVSKTTAFDWFNREEIDQLMVPAKDQRERAELLVAFDTGIRTGEQVALRWGDVNFHASAAFPHGWLSISKASSRGTVVGTKSGEVRKVPLTVRCAAALREFRGLKHLQDGLVFPDPEDASKVEDVREPDRRFGRACVRAGLRRMRRYGARHSFASNHVALGTPILQVSKWLGHSEIGITAKVYAHLAPIDGARWLAAYEAPTVASRTGT